MNLLMFPTIWGIKAAGTLADEALLGCETVLTRDVALGINQFLTFG